MQHCNSFSLMMIFLLLRNLLMDIGVIESVKIGILADLIIKWNNHWTTLNQSHTRRSIGYESKLCLWHPITSAISELSVFACFKSATNSEFASIVVAVWFCNRWTTFCVIPVQRPPCFLTFFQSCCKYFAEYSELRKTWNSSICC